MGGGWNREASYSKSVTRTWSSWSAPIIAVPKGYGRKHWVIDYCILNKVTRKFKEHASTNDAQISMCISWTKFIRNLAKVAKPLTLLTQSTSKTQVDTNPSKCFFNTQGISHPSTNITLPKSKEMLHSLYRCIRWCLRSTAVSGTWWNRISNSFPFTYLHWHKTEMEHYRTRSLLCILHSHKMELLPSESWNHSTQWSQTTGKIS